MKAHTTLTRLQQLLPELFNPIEVTGAPYLRFQLTPEIPALLSMEWVQEALLLSASSISPLPNMPDFSIGMVNARDRVFCVVDLAQLLGVATPLLNQREYQVIVVNMPDAASSVTDKLIGLAVSQVRGIARLTVAPAPPIDGEFPAILTPFLQGCLLVGDQRLVVLNATAIVTNPVLLVNSKI
jgi:positive phototaxis protein PixI